MNIVIFITQEQSSINNTFVKKNVQKIQKEIHFFQCPSKIFWQGQTFRDSPGPRDRSDEFDVTVNTKNSQIVCQKVRKPVASFNARISRENFICERQGALGYKNRGHWGIFPVTSWFCFIKSDFRDSRISWFKKRGKTNEDRCGIEDKMV